MQRPIILKEWSQYPSCQCNGTVRARSPAVIAFPDSKIRGANMGPIWVRQDPGGSHVGPMNFAIWELTLHNKLLLVYHGKDFS